ncbi:hypothetical protein D9615_001765 [Tricholomella constricta]|uniref:Uncharacterized protein n=1 Tax=Tricholomella constricta TaxID=117010 RepID=A0A8H5HP06_9AGAR|nr:hypothetical protein D9615_001765 [Tricholomella constricta]
MSSMQDVLLRRVKYPSGASDLLLIHRPSHPSHRHPSSHLCPVQAAASPEKTTAARALLAKNFPASSNKKAVSQRVPKIPTDPFKLAQYRKIELMKMRHRAIPGDPKDGPSSAPLDQRLHVKVAKDGGAEQIFWFRKGLQLIRFLANGDHQILLNDKAIVDQAEDGDTLVVAHIDSTTG